MGGYHGGFTAFLIFAVVYTAFMLEGWLAFGITVLELLFYTGLYVVSYRYPFLVSDFPAEKDYLRSNIMDFLIVGATLCVTMYVQVRLYRKQQQRAAPAESAAGTGQSVEDRISCQCFP